jgi:hypothetical protein
MIDGVPVVSELSGGKLRLIWRDRSGLAREYSSNQGEYRIVEWPVDCKWRVILPNGRHLVRKNSPISRVFSTARSAALAAEKDMELAGLL